MYILNVKDKKGGSMNLPFLMSVFAYVEFSRITKSKFPDFENGDLYEQNLFYWLCFEEGKRKRSYQNIQTLLPWQDFETFVDCIDPYSDDYIEGLTDEIVKAISSDLEKKKNAVLKRKAEIMREASLEALKNFKENFSLI